MDDGAVGPGCADQLGRRMRLAGPDRERAEQPELGRGEATLSPAQTAECVEGSMREPGGARMPPARRAPRRSNARSLSATSASANGLVT